MAVHEIRETLTGGEDLLVSTDDYLIIQKRINLPSGRRHTIMAVDHFDDGCQWANFTGSAANWAYEAFLTCYPVLPGDVVLPGGIVGRGGPLAGDDEVLFKAHRITAGASQRYETFPNQTLGAQPTFTFYTPHLYFTVIITSEDTSNWDQTVSQSIYVAVDSVDVGDVEYSMGVIQESNEAAWRVAMTNGVVLGEVEIIAGAPLWRTAGRPAYMTSTVGIVAGTNWWLDGWNMDGEAMEDTAALRFDLSLARQMAAPDAAFGVDESPDWFKQIAAPFAGLTGGPTRSNPVPIVKLTNGNTSMV